jgi:DNA-binding phage protein
VSTGVDIEAELRQLGKRRRDARRRDEEIVESIRGAVERARDSSLSMTRIGELLDIDRTQLYRTYLR